MKQRCCNIDWLEVYCLESVERFPCDANYYARQGYFVRQREYGTRVYHQMFTVEDEHGLPFVEIRRDPASLQDRNGGFFPPESCHIRLTNAACYYPDAIDRLRQFLVKHDYQLRKIFRLDICLDFELFDRGDDPDRFLQRYLQGRYSKINQANISAHGTDQWGGRHWNSVSWGQPKSMVSTKLYCKTLELATVKDKPYIRQAWFYAKLVDDPVQMVKFRPDGSMYKPAIWRVEFSIKSSANRWFVLDNSTGKKKKDVLPHSLDMYDSPLKLLTAFAALADHYFHFKVYEEGVRKDRCRDKVLFDFSPLDTGYKIDRLASHEVETKPLHRLLILLNRWRNHQYEGKVLTAVDTIVAKLYREQDVEYLGHECTLDDIDHLRAIIKQRLRSTKDDQPPVVRDLFNTQ